MTLEELNVLRRRAMGGFFIFILLCNFIRHIHGQTGATNPLSVVAGKHPERNDTEERYPEIYNAELIFLETSSSPDGINTSSNASSAPGGRPGQASDTHNCNTISVVPAHLRSSSHMWPHGLGEFYQKYTHAYGIPVLGSSRLSDDALRRACYVVRFLFADRPDIRRSYYSNFGRFALMAATEVTTNIPEHASLGAWWNGRARGLGATRERPVSTGGEENALCYDKDRYRVEDIVLHEFSHGLHLLGSAYAVPGFDGRLRLLYNSAKSSGRWANTYAMSTFHEYWAEGVQSYFDANAYANPPNGIHNHVNNRQRLRTYDLGLYELIKEVFPCGNTYIDRCQKSRHQEISQRLKINCDANGNGELEKGGNEDDNDNGKDCKDNEDRCPSWATDGWCERCPTYMKTSCKRSCNECPTSAPETVAPPTPKPPSPVDCKNKGKHCNYWASIGECKKNPAYMKTYCKKACKLC